MANNERLLRLALKLALEPESHAQGSWYRVARTGTSEEVKSMCGTTGCVAGHAQFMFGDSRTVFVPDADGMIYVPDIFGDYVFDQKTRQVRLYSYSLDRYSSPTLYSPDQVKTTARDLLGLKGDQAAWLFEGWRTRDEIFKAIQYLVDNPNATSYDLENHCM
jgi:hypothetical protein